MWIMGCDFHPRDKQIAMLDEDTGELVERLAQRPPRSRWRMAAARHVGKWPFSPSSPNRPGRFTRVGCRAQVPY
jgi:hypothetical protein